MRLILFALAFVLVIRSGFAQATLPAADEFVEFYAQQQEALKHAYHNWYASGVYEEAKTDADEFVVNYRFHIHMLGDLARLDNVADAGAQEVVVLGEQLGMELSKSAESDEFVLENRYSTGAYSSVFERIGLLNPVVAAPWQYLGADILEYLQRDNCVVTDVSQGVDGDAHLVRVEVTRKYHADEGNAESVVVLPTYFVFDTTNNWAVTEYMLMDPNNDKLAGLVAKVTYAGQGTPRPIESVEKYYLKRDGSRARISRYQIEDFDFGGARKRDFREAAFGLGPTRVVPLWAWMLSASVVLLLIAAYFSRRQTAIMG